MTSRAKSPKRTVPAGDSKARVPADQVMAEATEAINAAIEDVEKKLRDSL